MSLPEPSEPREPESTLDRRRARRDEVARPVELRFDAAALTGTTADLSEMGVLLSLEGDIPLRVTSGGRTWRARLVRSVPTGPDSSALAIEFLGPAESGGA